MHQPEKAVPTMGRYELGKKRCPSIFPIRDAKSGIETIDMLLFEWYDDQTIDLFTVLDAMLANYV